MIIKYKTMSTVQEQINEIKQTVEQVITQLSTTVILEFKKERTFIHKKCYHMFESNNVVIPTTYSSSFMSTIDKLCSKDKKQFSLFDILNMINHLLPLVTAKYAVILNNVVTDYLDNKQEKLVNFLRGKTNTFVVDRPLIAKSPEKRELMKAVKLLHETMPDDAHIADLYRKQMLDTLGSEFARYI